MKNSVSILLIIILLQSYNIKLEQEFEKILI